MSETLSKVSKIVSEYLGISLDQVKPESKLVEDLGADSLDQVELLMAYEEEFSIEVSDDDAQNLLTIDDIVKHVNKLAAEAA